MNGINWRLTLQRIINELPQFAYLFGDEKEFHDGIARVLDANGIPYQREFVAGPKDRFDFLCEGGVVIEAKIKGSATEAIRQVDRYCERNDVNAVLIVATKAWGRRPRWRDDIKLHGKAVRIVSVGGQSF